MLNQQIRETIQMFRDTIPADLSALIEQGAGEISALDIIERASRPGDALPDFALDNQHGERRTRQDYLARGPLVLTFYRGAWCPYCNLQLKAYAERLDEIQAGGATLVAVCPEKPDAVETLKSSGAAEAIVDGAVTAVPFDVLYDQGNRLAGALGLVFELPESHRQLLAALGVDIQALTGDDSFTFPDPATYVIEPSGAIAWAFVPNNYRKRAEVEQIVQALAQVRA